MRGVCKNFFCKFDFYKKCCGGVGEAEKSRFCGQKFRIATRELVHCGKRIGALQHANWCIAASELVHCGKQIGAPHHRKSLGVAASHSHTSHVGGSGNA